MPVLSSCRGVVSRCAQVLLHPEKIAPAISRWGGLLDAEPSWTHTCHFFDGTDETVRWIFTLDLLNHCFWPDPGEPAWTVRYKDEDWSGYWALAASLKRAVEWGIPVTDPAWMSRATAGDMERIFSGKGQIPLFNERLANLREAGAVILSDLGGDIVSIVEKASGSAARLVLDIVSHFPSFRDEAAYGSDRVYFWKRAQILAADVFAAFGGKGRGDFHDIDRLSAFADYKLPQVLRELGIISYNAQLAQTVDSLGYLDPGSAREVEIRAMTVVAVEEIRKAFEHSCRSSAAEGRPHSVLTSARVDGWLWRLGQMDEFRTRPYHRCRTIYY